MTSLQDLKAQSFQRTTRAIHKKKFNLERYKKQELIASPALVITVAVNYSKIKYS